MFNRHLHWSGLNILMFSGNNNSRYTRWKIFYYLKKVTKLKDIEKCAYIEGHRAFGIFQIEPVILQ